MKTKLLTLAALLIALVSFSQKKSRADRFFENGDYLNAIQQYAEQLNNGDYSKHVLENISTSYYNTFQFRRAYRSLNRLISGKFKGKDKTYDNQFNFKMYQVLSALGEYDKALPYFIKYKNRAIGVDVDSNIAMATIEALRLKDDDFVIKNEKLLNSEKAEFGAVKKGETIFFTSDRKSDGVLNKNYGWTHNAFLNLYKVEVDSVNAPKSKIEPFDKHLNSKLHEGNFCFTKDLNTIYISRSNTEKGRKKFDSIRKNAIHLYKSVKKGNVWSTPEKLVFNNIKYSMEHPALNAKEDKLYFASNMPGGYGDFDLYYVDVNLDGTYGNPVNLGDTVNTENREQFPFISSEGNLYFSSNGHLGLGMMDIFIAKYENNEFELPINLGAPINSNYDDFSLNYHNNQDGFFASNRNKKNDQIYSFKQIGEIFLRPYNTRFEVREFGTKKYIPNATVSLINSSEHIVFQDKLDSIAAFNMDVIPGKFNFKAFSPIHNQKIKPLLVKEKEEQTYVIYLQQNPEKIKQKDIENTNSLPIVKGPLKKEVVKTELLNDKEGPKVVVRDGKMFFELPPIYFDFGKWNIRADSKKVLDEFALKLEKYKSVYIKISAHTDSRGSNGEYKPLVTCEGKICTEEEHQINRRSEFEIIKY